MGEDAASGFTLNLAELMCNAIFFKQTLKVTSIVATYQTGCQDIFSASFYCARHIQTFTTGRVVTFAYTHNRSILYRLIHYIGLIYGCV